DGGRLLTLTLVVILTLVGLTVLVVLLVVDDVFAAGLGADQLALLDAGVDRAGGFAGRSQVQRVRRDLQADLETLLADERQAGRAADDVILLGRGRPGGGDDTLPLLGDLHCPGGAQRAPGRKLDAPVRQIG